MSGSDFFEYLQAELGWTKAGERIFVSANKWSLSARIDDHHSSRHWHMVEGYRRAGDILAEAMLDNPGVEYPVIYPLVFCYRHALELMLKHIITEYGKRVLTEDT